MEGYRADLDAILAVFNTMPDYQQSLVISELQRTLDRNLELNPDLEVTPVVSSCSDNDAVPKPKPINHRSNPI